jgi:hypothetical protein
VDNQHRQIKGYRELDQTEIDAMNKVKEMAEKVGELIAEFDKLTPNQIDPRWLSIGRTQLQQGFMALTRSVAKPYFF